MIPTQIAGHLIAHRQAALTADGALRRSMLTAARDDLAVWAAWLQTHPDALVQLLTLLVGDVASTRIERGLPVIETPVPDLPADPPVEISGGDRMLGHLPDADTLDRLGVMLATFADWTITVTLHDGETVTARPARAPLTPEQAPAGVTG